jgi:putative restriction endonuclease
MAEELARYLEFSDEEARRQWRRASERVQKPRQEPFLPIEVLLCYALFFILDPHTIGKSNVEKLPTEVKALARTLRRPLRSLPNKMLNLDGGLKNSAHLEPELFVRLASAPGLFVELYLRVMRAARDVGFDAEHVPDVLDALHEGRVELLGQDELGSAELGRALDENREELGRLAQTLRMGEQQTTRLVEQRVRLGQHRFADRVLKHYDHRCGFCGFAPHKLRHHRLLVASHIKPWACSTNEERLDPFNGIAACPTHDAAFDSGLITVNGGLRIHRAEPLRVSMVADEGTELYFGERVLGARLILRAERRGPDPRYLSHHHQHIFQGRLGKCSPEPVVT